MKIINYPNAICVLLLTLSCWVGCRATLVKPKPVNEPVAVAKDTVKHDTIHTSPLISKHDTIRVKSRTDKYLDDGILPPYDTLLKDHFRQQKLMFRAIDSSRSRKSQIDSIVPLLHDLQRQEAAFEKKYDQSSAAAKRADQYADQLNQEKRFTKYDVIAGFCVLLLLGLFNASMQVKQYRLSKTVQHARK